MWLVGARSQGLRGSAPATSNPLVHEPLRPPQSVYTRLRLAVNQGSGGSLPVRMSPNMQSPPLGPWRFLTVSAPVKTGKE